MISPPEAQYFYGASFVFADLGSLCAKNTQRIATKTYSLSTIRCSKICTNNQMYYSHSYGNDE